MLTKSKIQMIKESYAWANDYKDGLSNLMEKYDIKDNIFAYRNGQLFEATKGYFIKSNQYTDLMEAVMKCLEFKHTCAIRIINNSTYEVGEIKQLLSECSADATVYDINNHECIR